MTALLIEKRAEEIMETSLVPCEKKEKKK